VQGPAFAVDNLVQQVVPLQYGDGCGRSHFRRRRGRP
jgi:hypothetical protein